MKSTTLFMVSCVSILLVLNHIKEAEAVHVQRRAVCEFNRQFPGKCGNEGSNLCLQDMETKGAPNQKNLRCDCFDHPSIILGRPKRICKCRNHC
ncbi:hypothetical protein AALP_AA1G156400 [Arabis alpina]|uniref:Uncharacterized protein n=1 Tax=Arabis alpina TaxID=50452 RepID=A0A087HNF7_ARAAL|nr:hypothetical protein AALP_AA1G156400 [Arabis alpina]